MNQSEKRLFLIQSLLNERPSCQKQIIPADSERQNILLRGLMNVRRPVRIGADFLQVQDAYLQDETAAKGITDMAGRYYDAQVRCHRQRGKLRHDRLLYSQPSLH